MFDMVFLLIGDENGLGIEFGIVLRFYYYLYVYVYGYVMYERHISINRNMENEKSSRSNNLITHTSRQYYSRRIPQQTTHDTSRDQLQKIVKMLNINPDPQKSKCNRLKT